MSTHESTINTHYLVFKMGKSIALFIALAILAIGQTEVNARATLKIMNGKDAKEGEFPYMVQLLGGSEDSPQYGCAGTIIGSEWILTSGSCVNQIELKAVASGSTKVYPDDSNDLHTIEQTFIHPAFEVYGVPRYDIGLVQLAKPLKFTDKVQAVKLPDAEDVPFHVFGILTGWGTLTAEDRKPAKTLQKVSVELSTDEECTDAFNGSDVPSYVFNPTHHVCSNDHGSGQCLGDTGSALVINGTQYGVASWAIKGCGGGPGAYSRLTNPEYRDWIKDTSGI